MSLQGQTLERTGSKIKEPKRYNVVMLNDDFTTMDFVVEILIDIFHKEQLTAEAIMLDVQNKGKAVVGTYAEGAFKTVKDAKEAFEKQLKEDGLLE